MSQGDSRNASGPAGAWRRLGTGAAVPRGCKAGRPRQGRRETFVVPPATRTYIEGWQ